MTKEERIDLVKKLSLCFNCLKPGHVAEECRKFPCKCGEKQHYRIHECKKQYIMTLKNITSQTLCYVPLRNKRILTMPDLGSDISIISLKLAKQLKLKKLGTITLTFITVNDEITQKSPVFELEIKGLKIKTFAFSKMPWLSQKGYNNEIPQIDRKSIDLILGNNTYQLIKHLKERKVKEGVIIETAIGKMFYPTENDQNIKVNMLLEKTIKKKKKISIEEEQMTRSLDKEMKILEKTIEAPLMLRKNVTKTLCSFSQAKHRLLSQLKKIKASKEFENMYNDAIYAYMDEGYAIEKQADIKALNFIPHHMVINKRKKPRIVFACNTNGKNKESLNDYLAKGVINMNEIPTILSKWRERKFFTIADIKAMYHQIHLLKKHYGLCAFLYWKKGEEKTENNIKTFVMTRHVFGAKDSPCVALKALEKMIDEMKGSKEEKQEVKQSFYMDDMILSSENPKTIEKLSEKTKKALHPQFLLTKIHSNVANVQKKYEKEIVLCKRVLGIAYDSELDKIEFDTSLYQINKESPTYNDMASALMKLYDPQGLMEPIRAAFKTIYSREIKKKKNWKDKLDKEVVEEWNGLANKYKIIQTLPRYVGKIEEYAVFVDASKTRLGAALYGVVNNKYMILASKSRVIPKKKQLIDESIPNNELNAAVLGAELVQEYKFENSNKQIYYYSDNKAVLHYIKNTSIPVDEYKRRRIEKIIKLSNPQQWSYVKSEENPADLLTKNPSLEQLNKWFTNSKNQIKVMMVELPWNTEKIFIHENELINQIKLEQEKLDISKLRKYLNVQKGNDGIWKIKLRKIKGMINEKILLSNKMNVAEVITRQIHEKAHIGIDSIRTQLRQNYYTIGETELAKRVYRNCKQCKQFTHSNKFEYQANEPHPSQVQKSLYQKIGLDHTGALLTKEGNKIYILILICLYSRHITLKIVNSLDANEVELVLIQTEANFGGIEEIHSDNYKSFRKLEKKHKNWHFTSAYAPYQGGSWERAIKSTKRILAPYLGRKLLVTEWQTLCVIAENAINNKPLNQLIDDPEQEVITPQKIASNFKFTKDSITISHKWRKYLKQMIKEWHIKMLQTIMRQKRIGNTGIKPKKGQIVLLKDNKQKRNTWKKYRIIQLVKSHDNYIRNVILEGEKGKEKIRRSVKDLVLIN